MRNLVSRSAALGVVVVGLGLAATPAFADAYEVKFDEISTNCERPLHYPKSTSIKIDVKGSDIQVDIDRTPLMIGKAAKPGAKSGKINAKSPKPGRTPMEGMDGTFSVAGRITDDGMVSLVLIGEYQQGGRPLCTQSWNLSGLKKK